MISTNSRVTELLEKFHEKHGREDLVVEAPGRINIIGEHTDYNDGFVLPAAIDKTVMLIINKNDSKKCVIDAADLDESYVFSLDDPIVPKEIGWVNYFLGVLAGVSERFPIAQGFNVMFASSIPIGSGLSSSAAIECAFGFALDRLYNLAISPIDLAKIGQKAEHDYAGVNCGIMDQFAVVMGKKDKVIKLDCRSLEYDYYPAEFGDYDLVLFDTHVKHNLASSEYNIRRRQCREGTEVIQQLFPEVSALRDVTITMLNEARPFMSNMIYQRCEYIIEENKRVIDACAALENNDFLALGVLMYQAHHGLSNQYQVSCKELDILVDLARNSGQVAGARMMGGGFGGCTINLIESAKVSEVIAEIQSSYTEQTGKVIEVYRVKISDGVGVINV